MKDLFSILKKTRTEFSLVKDEYKIEEEKISNIESSEDFLEISNNKQLKEVFASLNPESRMDTVMKERIIGKNNLMDISYFKKGLQVAQTVCRIIKVEGDNKRPYGTGFLIGEGLLMTNNHVIENQNQATQLSAEFEYEKNISGIVSSSAIFKIKPDVFFITNEKLDYTVVALEPIAANNPSKELIEYGFNKLSTSKGQLFKGKSVSIIQHPEGLPKMIAIRENQIVLLNEPYVHYTTDTQPGSSGSLVANDEWEIIALHRSGVPEEDEEGNIRLTKGGIWRNRTDNPFINWIANQGVLMSVILDDISSKKVREEQELFRSQILRNYTPKKNTEVYRLPGRK